MIFLPHRRINRSYRALFLWAAKTVCSVPLRDLNDVKHWRDRATEMRALAEDMGDANATRLMLDLANDYEKLADRAAERAKVIEVNTYTPSPLGRSSPPESKQ